MDQQLPEAKLQTSVGENTDSSFRKLHVLITLAVGLLMLAIGLAGGYFLFGYKTQTGNSSVQQTTHISPTVALQPQKIISDTSSWKTYTGKSYSFEYPSDFGIAPLHSNADGKTYTELVIVPKAVADKINELTKQGTGMGGTQKDTMLISTYPAPADSYKSDDIKTVVSKTVTVAKQPAIQYVITYKKDVPAISAGEVFTDTVMDYSGTTYTFALEDPKRLKEYNHLLTTFTFVSN